MELKYIYAESTIKPVPIETVENTVYLRMNITESKRTTEQGNVTTYWTYQEANLTLKEFNDYANLMLISAQKSGDDNQLIIMDAIADLYDVIASIMV